MRFVEWSNFETNNDQDAAILNAIEEESESLSTTEQPEETTDG